MRVRCCLQHHTAPPRHHQITDSDGSKSRKLYRRLRSLFRVLSGHEGGDDALVQAIECFLH